MSTQKLTKRQKELLDTVRGETSGRLTVEMGCHLLQTTPQAFAKLCLALSGKGLAYRDGEGTVRLS
jgi:hypothetical protein